MSVFKIFLYESDLLVFSDTYIYCIKFNRFVIGTTCNYFEPSCFMSYGFYIKLPAACLTLVFFGAVIVTGGIVPPRCGGQV